MGVDQIDENPGYPRGDNPRALPDNRVHRHRAHHYLPVDEVGVEGLTGRIVESLHTAGQKCYHQYVPSLHNIQEGQSRQQKDQAACGELGEHDQTALVQSVCEDAAKEVEKDPRDGVGRADQAQGPGVAGDLVDEPALAHPKHLQPAHRRQ